MAKLPSFQFYPGDWMKDPALRCCSLAARGLWLDMLCLMFECDRRGYLQVNGKPTSLEQLARMTGCSTDEASRCLQELEDSGVCSRTEHGIIYSRRLVRDDQIRDARAKAGSLGGSKKVANQVASCQQKCTPSSSPSSSSSASADVSLSKNVLGGVGGRGPPSEIDLLGKFNGYPMAFGIAWDSYPEHKRSSKVRACEAWKRSVEMVKDRFAGSEAKAEDWIAGRLRLYSQSPIAGTKFCKAIAQWLEEGRYDDDDAAWKETAPSKARKPSAYRPAMKPKPLEESDDVGANARARTSVAAD